MRFDNRVFLALIALAVAGSVHAAAASSRLSVNQPAAGEPLAIPIASVTDPVVGAWNAFPAIGPTSRSCRVTFSKISTGSTGRVDVFACHQVEGLGGLNGIARVNKWERKGDWIILSGIAERRIGEIYLPVANARTSTVGGTMKGDLRFTLRR